MLRESDGRSLHITFMALASFTDLVKEFSISAVLHKDVDLVFLLDDLIHLRNLQLHQILLQFYLDGLNLVSIIRSKVW